MWLKDIRKDSMGLTKTAMAIIIVVLLLASTFAAVVLVFNDDKAAVGNGDSITVNYYGTVTVQGEERVFDTSLWDIAKDNATHPKTAWFTMRTQASYSSFTFTVGRSQTVVGFDQGVRGMKEGDTKTIVIPPEKGYGLMDSTRVKTFNLNQTATVFSTTTISGFNSTFGSVPSVGLTVTHPIYKWPVFVYSVDQSADIVQYQNVAVQGSEYHVYGSSTAGVVAGWDILITSVDSTVNNGEGLIEFNHQINETNSWDVKGYTGTTSFILIDVDTVAGTAKMNYNSPLAGLTMTFHVTVESIN